jgi:hypothetical protein
VLLVALPSSSTREPAGDTSVERGDGVAALETRGPASGAAAAPIALDWTPVATATRYRVTVYTDVGRVAWGPTDVAAPPARVPALAAGAYRWHVEAFAGGRSIARSAFAPLAVRP